MDKLEAYLDQVCRGIAGPRSLRQHVRQELREHLRDAAAEYRAGGMSEGDALDRALADFGGPDQVRSELEATHGHRLMAVVIDKAMQWKERTMKAKWFWNASAHALLVLAIVAQVATLAAVVIFIVPKHYELLRDITADATNPEIKDVVGWSARTLNWVVSAGQYFLWILLVLAIGVAVFEWLVRSEHKTFIRLTGLSAMALGLTIEVGFVMAALILPWMILAPGMLKASPAPRVARQLGYADETVEPFKTLLAKPTWDDNDRRTLPRLRAKARDGIATVNGMDGESTIVATRHPDEVRETERALEAAVKPLSDLDTMGDEAQARQHIAAFLDAYQRLQSLRRPSTQPAP